MKNSQCKYLRLDGTAINRGLTHGRKLKSLIREGIERWKFRLYTLNRKAPHEIIEEFVENTSYIDTVERVAPHLLEEVKGIGEGSKVDFNTIFAYQCMDEIWRWSPDSKKCPNVEGCSVIGTFRGGHTPTILGQNMDLPSYYQGLETLINLRDEDSSQESFIVTFAGMIGLCGLNNTPLGLCGNTLLDLNGSLDGYPVAFFVRSILEQDSLESAMNFVKTVKHASGQNYSIGNTEGVVSLECSSNKVCEFYPFKGAKITYHTNHPIVNDDLRVPPYKQTWSRTTHARFEYLENRLREPFTPIDLETMKLILSSHEGPICAHQSYQPGSSYTFSSLIHVLSKKPELHLTWGPPCSSTYETLRFE